MEDHPRHLMESCDQPKQKLSTVIVNGADGAVANPRACGADAGRTDRVDTAGFESIRQVLGHLLALRARARATAHQRLDVEPRRQQQNTDSGRSEEALVAGSRQRRDAHFCKIDLQASHRLGRVDQHRHRRHRPRDLGHRQHGTGDIAGVVHDHQRGRRSGHPVDHLVGGRHAVR